jgi:hypothetical protein
MVSADDVRERFRSEGRRDDLDAHLVVRAHDLPLFLGKRSGLKQDRVGDSELADIVQHRGDFQKEAVVDAHQPFGGRDAEVRDALAVLSRLGGVAVCEGAHQALSRHGTESASDASFSRGDSALCTLASLMS